MTSNEIAATLFKQGHYNSWLNSLQTKWLYYAYRNEAASGDAHGTFTLSNGDCMSWVLLVSAVNSGLRIEFSGAFVVQNVTYLYREHLAKGGA